VDFLHRLAATALGESGSLRAALPARYASVPVEPAEVEPLAAVQTPQSTAPAARLATAWASAARSVAGRETPPASARAPVTRTDPPERVPHPTTMRDPTAPTQREPRPLVSSEVATRERRPTPVTLAPPSPPRVERSPREVATSVDEASVTVPRTEPVARAAPLDVSLVALHAERRSADAPAPVIHVTIDRIDVRAPAQTPARGDKPAARPAPDRSLADYLRGRAR
jgi:hypothetical protein